MKVKEFFQDLYDITGMDPNEPMPTKWVDINEAEIYDRMVNWDREYRDCYLEAVEWAITRFKELNK